MAYLQPLLNPRHQRLTMLKKFSGNMDRRIRQISSKEKIVYQSTNASRYKLAKKSCSVFSTNPLKTSKFLLRSFFKKSFYCYHIWKNKACFYTLRWVRYFDTVFRRRYRCFSIVLKVILSLSDRYKLFTSDWLWIEVCQNAVFTKIDGAMTTINKKHWNR